MTKIPHHRFSFCDMFGRERQYMLVFETSRMMISVTHDHLLEIESNFREEDKPNAEEWLQEVALDISKSFGGKPDKLFNMIKAGL